MHGAKIETVALQNRSDRNYFYLYLALYLMPLWCVPYLPLQDSSTHIANAAIGLQLERNQDSLLSEFYEVSGELLPTWGGYAVAQFWLRIFPFPLLAEKIYLAGSVVLLLMGARRIFFTLTKRATPAIYFVYPLAYGYLFHMGFVPFSYSLGLALFLLDIWWRNHIKAAWKAVMPLTIGFLLLWLAHPVTFVTMLVALNAVAVVAAVRPRCRCAYEAAVKRTNFMKSMLKSCSPLLVSAVPAGILTITFTLEQSSESHPRFLSVMLRLRRLASLDILVSYSSLEVWLAGAQALIVGSLVLIAFAYKVTRSSWIYEDALLAAPVACLLLYLIAPDGVAGGGWVSARISVLVYLTILIWLGAQRMPRSTETFMAAAGITLTLLFVLCHVVSYRDINAYLREYVELARAVPDGATLLPITLTRWGTSNTGQSLSIKVRPMLHAGAYVALDRENSIMLLNNYQAGKGYFPVRYREDVDPFKHLATGDGFAAVPPQFDLQAYRQRTDISVSHILIWGHVDASDSMTDNLMRQIAHKYEIVARSTPSGMGVLYGKFSTPRLH